MQDPPLGEQYQQVLVHDAGETVDVPSPAARTVGDLVDPFRAGDVLTLINVVTNATGQDAAEWPVARITAMLGMLEASAPRQ